MKRRPGFILFVVVIVAIIGAMVASSALLAADAQRAATELSLDATQTRALAWSAVQGVMDELSEQRDDLLEGKRPNVTDTYTLYSTESGREAVVRLIDLDPDTDGVMVSESGKLNINTATAEMLAMLPQIDETLAKAIVDGRGESGYGAVSDLLRIEGVTPAMLVGAEEFGGDEATTFVGGGSLEDVLTVYSFDPNVQSGLAELGQDGSQYRGNKRLNLNVPWSDRLGRALDERFGDGVGEFVKGLIDQGQSFETMSDLVGLMVRFNAEPDQMIPACDAISPTDDEYLVGRVDLLTAPPEVLACIPGFDDDIAASIVDARERLDDESRLTIVWPLSQGLITPEQLRDSSDHVTTRAMQWRVRVEVGFRRADDFAPASVFEPADDIAGFGDDEEPLESRMVIDAIIDVASERPRVAMMRDVTHLDSATRLASQRARTLSDDRFERRPRRDDAPIEDDPLALAPEFPSFLDDPFAMVGPTLEGEDELPSDEPEEQAPSRRRPLSTGAPSGASSTEEESAGRDPRIGRWRAGGGG